MLNILFNHDFNNSTKAVVLIKGVSAKFQDVLKKFCSLDIPL